MIPISKITTEEILDSRGIPTLKTTVFLDDGSEGSASVPTGVSTGSNEALELRDGDPNRYSGQGVLKAVENVQGLLFQAVKNIDPTNQEKIDENMLLLDRTQNKSRFGANAILSISLAVAVAVSASQKIPLYEYLRQKISIDHGRNFQMPLLMANIFEGGKHAGWFLDFQEFLLVPKGFRFFGESYANVNKLISSLKSLIKQKKLGLRFGMEGGFAVRLKTNEEAIALIKEAMKNIELYEAGFGIGLDIAANSIYGENGYRLKDVDRPLDTKAYIEFLAKLNRKHKLFSLEDPLIEDDWVGWSNLSQKISGRTLVIGDDLTTTNKNRLDKALSEEALSGVVVKPNQIGTLTETLSFIAHAKKAGLKVVVSHRGGETMDTFISDLAVAVGADFIKIGSPLQKERMAKYNRLLEIERELAKK